MKPFRLDERTSMLFLSIGIGILGGLGAVLFRWMIGSFEELAWSSGESPLDRFLASPVPLRILVPAAGGLLVGLIVKFFAPEAKGHGVPEVMFAVARKGGVIRPVVAVAKAFASAICIATGGSVGREGPIVQIGSALGSTLGQVFRLSSRRVRTAVGCGAAAGIAATFNAPIAGAFFAAEVLLGEFGVGAFSSVVVSAVSATIVSRTLVGDVPAFSIPTYSIVNPAEMITYVILGLLAGIVGVAFVAVLHVFEDVFAHFTRIPDYVRPVIGGLLIGCLGLMIPQVLGVGYETISDALHGKLGLSLLIVILLAKMVATSLTLGSGGSGGVFAPALFMGAALGGIVGHVAAAVFSFPMASPGAYAVVGMGAMVAAATHAPITAIFIIFEMTGDYRVILGLMVSCTIGTLVAQHLRRESIYTIKLVRRGIDLEAGQDLNVLRKVKVGDVARPHLETVPHDASLEELYRRMVASPRGEFLVLDDNGGLIGSLGVDDLVRTLSYSDESKRETTAKDLIVEEPTCVRDDDTLDFAMRQFGKQAHRELPVLASGDSRVPIGIIRRRDIINAYNEEIVKLDLAGSISSSIGAANKVKSLETLGNYVIVQIDAPPFLCGRPLLSLDLRKSRGVQIILIEESGGQDFVFPSSNTVLNPGDKMVVIGHRSDVDRLMSEIG